MLEVLGAPSGMLLWLNRKGTLVAQLKEPLRVLKTLQVGIR